MVMLFLCLYYHVVKYLTIYYITYIKPWNGSLRLVANCTMIAYPEQENIKENVKRAIGLTPPLRKEMDQLVKEKQLLDKKLKRAVQIQKARQKVND